jgi:hypothetical protein
MSVDSNQPQTPVPRFFYWRGQPKAPAALQVPLSSSDTTQAEIDAVTAVLRTPHLSLGHELAAFEAAPAAYPAGNTTQANPFSRAEPTWPQA